MIVVVDDPASEGVRTFEHVHQVVMSDDNKTLVIHFEDSREKEIGFHHEGVDVRVYKLHRRFQT